MIAQLVVALTLVAEAGGIQDVEAMNRVLTVIWNRAEARAGGGGIDLDTLAIECKRPKQFSCWDNPKLMAKAKKHPKLGIALSLIKLPAERSKEVGSAKHYLARWLYYSNKCPKWAKTGRIVYDEGPGGHVFLEGVK